MTAPNPDHEHCEKCDDSGRVEIFTGSPWTGIGSFRFDYCTCSGGYYLREAVRNGVEQRGFLPDPDVVRMS